MPVGFVSLAQASSNEYFVQSTSGTNIGHWTCKLCTSQTFVDKSKHCKLKTHIDQVRVELERHSMSRPTVAPPGLRSRVSQSTSENKQLRLPEDDGVPDCIHETGAPDRINELFDEDMDSSSSELESLYAPSYRNNVDFPVSRESSVDLDDILDGSSDSESATGTLHENEQRAITNAWLPWYPLRKKEHAASLLMLGTGRDLMSTAEYTRIRCILKKILHVDLPDLGHLKNICTELKACLGLRVLEQTSPLGNPCFSLSVIDIISQESRRAKWGHELHTGCAVLSITEKIPGPWVVLHLHDMYSCTTPPPLILATCISSIFCVATHDRKVQNSFCLKPP